MEQPWLQTLGLTLGKLPGVLQLSDQLLVSQVTLQLLLHFQTVLLLLCEQGHPSNCLMHDVEALCDYCCLLGVCDINRGAHAERMVYIL